MCVYVSRFVDLMGVGGAPIWGMIAQGFLKLRLPTLWFRTFNFVGYACLRAWLVMVLI
ncbi:hypothetical protein SODALDRAFT_332701 [Sodiomyces alkalinus F11]|uniref:Uncharacterized protein n=1 Tax=Sodiomyces alkalinus (strain CBS 110278 / VKM F-3762 / F11) TaxID=1314773 RepID=A0A3N2PXM1_SODAK|nr:hypothetical protein SODALDRAFT_332701 [Sodiomyces alkalinus F11]ROT39261.1 hypothetical protein SODALDRAFT_332701 [Sodiomyces alkalinus F11]